MSEEMNNNEATQPLHPASDETQPVSPHGVENDATRPVRVSESPTQPFAVVNPANQAGEPETGMPETASEEKPVRPWRIRMILLGLLLVLIAVGAGSFAGYRSGLDGRKQNQSSQIAVAAAQQFQLGLDDINNQRYEMARSRFEYVIKLNPNFPGAKEKLAEVMIALIPTEVPTPTLTPTPVFTPTPDTRGEEQIYTQIKQLLADKKWDEAIVSIESIRTKNLQYKTVEIDGFYFVALRNRGVDRILRQGDLEGGMYDLALTERFGPLDKDADSYRLYARLYVTGASFWQVDWEKATNYFEQVAPYLPNLRDSSNIFAIDRYRQAAANWAQKLMDGGDACKASKLLDKVFQNNYRNPTFEPLATDAAQKCSPATDTPQPTATITPTVKGTLTRTVTGAATLTPSVTKGSSASATPSPTTPTGATATSTTTKAAASTSTPTPTTPAPPTTAATPTATATK